MVSGTPLTAAELLDVLDEVKDPEVPVLSVVELGIVRGVERVGGGAVVTLTPTYSGCPAMREIETEIRRALATRGIDPVEIRTTYAPAWTTDWISDKARAKLEAYGIAPPGAVGGSRTSVVQLERRAPVSCPRCGSRETTLTSEFGSTACKALRVCRACGEPFEEFKAI